MAEAQSISTVITQDNPDPCVEALSARLKDGPLTVWAILREDRYETSFGDGYYAYVDQVFLNSNEAALAAESVEPDQMIKWHIRRYDLSRAGGDIFIAPGPTESEPTTIRIIAGKLGSLVDSHHDQ